MTFHNRFDKLAPTHHPFNNGEPAETLSEIIQIVSAPGEPREVREVIRATLQTSYEKEIAFHDVGILLQSTHSRLFMGEVKSVSSMDSHNRNSWRNADKSGKKKGGRRHGQNSKVHG